MPACKIFEAHLPYPEGIRRTDGQSTRLLCTRQQTHDAAVYDGFRQNLTRLLCTRQQTHDAAVYDGFRQHLTVRCPHARSLRQISPTRRASGGPTVNLPGCCVPGNSPTTQPSTTAFASIFSGCCEPGNSSRRSRLRRLSPAFNRAVSACKIFERTTPTRRASGKRVPPDPNPCRVGAGDILLWQGQSQAPRQHRGSTAAWTSTSWYSLC